MPARPGVAYNCTMTVATEQPTTPRFALAGTFLEALADQDFARLATTLRADAQLRALVPQAVREAAGPVEICAMFERWFGDTEEFELVEAVIGDVGASLHMHWRVRVRAGRLGPGWYVVEQQAYADTDVDGRISRLRVLCSGYCPETRAAE